MLRFVFCRAPLYSLCFFCGAAARGAAAEEALARYVRFQTGDTTAYGAIVSDGKVREIDGDLYGRWKFTDKVHNLADLKLLFPTERSAKVFAVGLNYRSHLGDRPVPKVPEIFIKVPSCLIGPGEAVELPSGSSDVHFEAELVIVIGKQAKNVSPEEAGQHIFGVTCGNDISARDWQKGDLQWWRAKGADTFGPCGPMVVTGLNYDDLLVEMRVNGETKQKQRTSDLIHSCGDIVSWISRHATLEPGDLIYTGTPGTTSAIKPGDVVEVEIEGIGVLKNPVVAGK